MWGGRWLFLGLKMLEDVYQFMYRGILTDTYILFLFKTINSTSHKYSGLDEIYLWEKQGYKLKFVRIQIQDNAVCGHHSNHSLKATSNKK